MGVFCRFAGLRVRGSGFGHHGRPSALPFGRRREKEKKEKDKGDKAGGLCQAACSIALEGPMKSTLVEA